MKSMKESRRMSKRNTLVASKTLLCIVVHNGDNVC